MIRVNLRSNERTVSELEEMFSWCYVTLGLPTTDDDMRWTYGKDMDARGSDMCSGIFEIEWFKFSNEEDRMVFKLKYGL